MTKNKTDVIAKNASQNIAYFLSCYDGLQHANYTNSNLDAFELCDKTVFYYETCSSTNDVLIDYAHKKVELKPAVCISETQYAGRGQHNRSWESVDGNLHMSVLVPVRHMFDLNGKMALEVAMSLLDMPLLSNIKMHNIERMGIKWPNDLCMFHENGKNNKPELHKFGGILIEPVHDRHGSLMAVVIGIGLNANHMQTTKVDNQHITSVQRLLGYPVDLGSLAAEACYACQHAILRFTRGSAGIFARFYLHDLLYELPLSVKHADGSMTIGHAAGVNEDGALKIDTGNETTCIYEGKITLK